MSCEHFVRCDVLNEDGNQCETRERLELQYELPVGWSRVIRFREATAADVNVLGAMRPFIEKADAVIRDKPEHEPMADALQESVDEMERTLVHRRPPIHEEAIVCPKHALPKVTCGAPAAVPFVEVV